MIKNSNEYLLNNHLDKDFQDMLFPLNLMQFVVFMQRYRILHGFVTPNGVRGQVMSMLGTLLVILLHSISIYNYYLLNPDHKQYTTELVMMQMIILFRYGTVYAVHIKNTMKYVDLILKMNQVSKLMTSIQLKTIKKWNWISVLLPFFFYLTVIFTGFFFYSGSIFNVFVFVFTAFYQNANVLFAIRTISFLTHSLKSWELELNSFMLTCSEMNRTQLRNNLAGLREQSKKLFQIYLDIQEAFNICGSVFRAPVSIQWSLYFDLYIITQKNIFF